MIRKDGISSQHYRHDRGGTFKKLRDNVWGGYAKGVINGPFVSTERGKRRHANRRQVAP